MGITKPFYMHYQNKIEIDNLKVVFKHKLSKYCLKKTIIL